LILTLFDDSIGKLFRNNGDIFEGEFQDYKMNGFGRKFNSAGKLLFIGFFSKGILILKI